MHVDWSQAPDGVAEGLLTVTSGSGAPILLPLKADRLPGITRTDAQGFVKSDGYVALEAADTISRCADGAVHWAELPGYGETRSAMTVFPVTAASDLHSSAALPIAYT